MSGNIEHVDTVIIGGLERYLRDLADATRSGTIPGTPEFAAIAARYDFVVPT
jgi:hypothetical protein